ncbi:MAG: HD domain-containing protein [Candidatus Micrarchaeota archaeon]
MYVIKDSVHGNIKLTDLELELLDSREMQRLRGIKQLALTNLVYPGANHTRFEHSLGTVHLTGEMCESMDLSEMDEKELRIAALLHDVGHGAFSHESEYFLKKHLGETHESIAEGKIRSNGIAGPLKKAGVDPARISSLLKGEGLGVLITSGVGSDRMDYLLRDSYYTGVAYGVIDSERLIHTMSLSKGDIVLEEGGFEAAESLLLARFMMFSTVYSHHAVRIASAMLRRAIELGIESGALRPVDLASLDDFGVLKTLLSNPKAGRFVRDIENRELFKRAFVYEWNSLQGKSRKVLEKNGGARTLAKEIAASIDVAEDDVLVDVPTQQYKEAGDVLVDLESGMRKLTHASDLVSSIKAAEEKRQRLIVACPQGLVKRVEKAAREKLGI